jgi:gliding motility-associated-like protein
LQQPGSGALATIANGILELDYTGIAFTGTDFLTFEICDAFDSCVNQILEIKVIGEIEIYNAVSANGDEKNEIFFIESIDLIESKKNNTVSIYNRWGTKVFEVKNYNNTTNVFRGLNDNGNELPSGTYFYKIVYTNKEDSGYLVLKR